MSINAEWTNADSLGFRPYTAYESASVTYSTATTDTISGLLAENAKLRELVRDMWSAYHDGATNKEFRALPDRMREMGVDA